MSPSSPISSRAVAPELEVLLLCGRSRPDEGHDARLRTLLACALDWGRLIRLAWINRLIPLLHWHLIRIGAAPPEWAVKHLRETNERNTARGRLMAERLAGLAASLERADLPAIAFKGPTLEAHAYAQPGLRECADLDFLFREPDMPAVLSVLQAAGYRNVDSFTPVQERIFRGYHFAYELVDASGVANIDAHWRLLPSTWTIPVDYEGLWRRSRNTEIGGQAVRVLCDEDLLFYLALHSTKERWLRLRMICDVAELLHARPTLDWDRALVLAEAQGGRRILLLAAHLAASWLDAPVPDRIRALAGADGLIHRLESGIWRAFERGTDDMSRLFDLSLFRLLVLDRLGDRLGYVVRTAATPRLVHTQIVRLPEPLIAGYVPLKLVYDYLAIPVWKLIRRWRAPTGQTAARPNDG